MIKSPMTKILGVLSCKSIMSYQCHAVEVFQEYTIESLFLMKKLDVFDLYLIHPLLEFIHLINQFIFHFFKTRTNKNI